MPSYYPCCTHCLCDPPRNHHLRPCPLCQDKDS